MHFSPAIYFYISNSPSRSLEKFQRVFHETSKMSVFLIEGISLGRSSLKYLDFVLMSKITIT